MQNRIDAKKLKAQLTLTDYEKILHDIGIPIYSKSSTQWICWTGDKNVDAFKGSPKLYFYTDTKVFMSWTASRSYDIIGLVQQRLSILKRDCSFLDAVNEIIAIIGLELGQISRINSSRYSYDWENALGKYIRFNKYGTELPVYDPIILDQLDQCIPQPWIDEGIGVDTMLKYRIGYYPRLNCTTIPCHDIQGNLIGIRTRNWNKEDIESGRKYVPLTLLDGETTFKFNTNGSFYGINFNAPMIEQTGTVWLGESEKFCLKLDTWFGVNNVALGMYGKNLGKQRRDQLLKLGVNKIIYVPDNDWIDKSQEKYDEWEKEIMTFAKQFKGYATVEIVYDNLGLLGSKENATDRDLDTWQQLFDNREIIT